MSIISTKAAYGLIAIVILARENKKLMQIKEIASQGGISPNFLEQILSILKTNGIVESVRGAHGGYRLAKSPEQIKVYDVFVALGCCDTFANPNSFSDILRPFWDYAQEKMEEVFSLNIKELNDYLNLKSNNYIYYI